MYKVNGVALDDTSRGWYMLRRSQILNSVSKSLSAVSIPGRNGVLPGVPAFRGATTSMIVMRCPGTELENLYALFLQNGGTGLLELADDSSRVAVFELASIDPQGINAKDELVNVSITLRFPTAEWRDTTQTVSAPSSVTDPVETFDILPDISSDITDMDIFIGGNFGNFELEDVGSGSWLHSVLSWPYVAGTGLLYVGATGQAFRATTASPWVPVTDMSQYVDVSGGGGFRITPTLIGGDPSDRIAQLELTTTSQTSLTFGFRATNSYALRNGAV